MVSVYDPSIYEKHLPEQFQFNNKYEHNIYVNVLIERNGVYSNKHPIL